MGNSFGTLFRATTFGESHGGGIGVVIDGCPARLTIDIEAIQSDLDRRRPGQSALVTQRDEHDRVEILSGLLDDRTTLGTPIAMLVRNADARPGAYDHLEHVYRPGHADATYDAKYGIRSFQGGGRSSARETIGRVAAGAVARQLLSQVSDIEVLAWVDSIGPLCGDIDASTVTLAEVEAHPTRCPDSAVAEDMASAITAARSNGDSIGGTIRCVARNVPPGLGVPVFDRLEADLAKAMLSLPATKGFEIGDGFASTTMTGREHNDEFRAGPHGPEPITNHAGGVLGGISSGAPIEFRVAFKPTATINSPQRTVDDANNEVELS
ncbi:MAG: chorismate synthase, partial [Acidobacteria bacterium]|nr:chorismate synthase [Acidobacteriota bacterium]